MLIPAQAWRSPLLGAALSLYAVQGFNYLIPLLLVPYLLRTLGPVSYGSIIFAQSLMGYAVVVTDYGFNLTAARDVSVARADAWAVAKIYWTIMAAKALLLASSFVVIALAVVLVPALRHIALLITCCGTLAIGSIAFPQWYLQGLERLKETAAIQALARLLTAAGTVLFVHSPADILVAAVLMSAPQVAAVFAAKFLHLSMAPPVFVRPSAADVCGVIRSGWHMFVSNASIALYGHTNSFALGLFGGEQALAVYSVGYKLISVIQGLAVPLIQAVFPRASALFASDPAAARALLLQVTRWLMPAIGIASLLLALFAPTVVDLISGGAYPQAVTVTRILCAVPLCVTAALILAQCVMVNNGLTASLSRIYLTVGFLNLVLLPGLVIQFAAEGAAMSLVVAELLGPLLMLNAIQKKRRSHSTWLPEP